MTGCPKERNPKLGDQVLYEELRPDEFIERINKCPIAYLPLGTLEWHGLHLPLGSDGIQSREIFVILAEKIGGIVLPMLFLGPDLIMEKQNEDDFSYVGMDCLSFEEGHMQQLEGSAYYIEEDLFLQVLETVLWNLSRAGFKIVVAHGHGPSTKTFNKNIEKFEKQFGLKLFDLWNLGARGSQGIQTDHAAYNETSLVMGLKPELVDIGRISNDADMVGIGGADPRNSASHEEGIKIINDNLLLIGEKIKKELSEISWDRREIKYTHVKKLYQ